MCEGEVAVGEGLACGVPGAVSSAPVDVDVWFAPVPAWSGTAATEDGETVRG